MKKKRRGCLMNKFKAGQKVRVIGDTFKADPHGLEVGSVYEIDSISKATSFNEFPPHVKLMFLVSGIKPYDLPERVHVKTGAGLHDYANLVFEDVELIAEAGQKVRMLEDDFAEGYLKGDVFETFEENGSLYFYDRDGDIRPLEVQAYETI
jgi:hypothetical protein